MVFGQRDVKFVRKSASGKLSGFIPVGVATVNGSGLVTGVANGICNITAVAYDNAAAKARTSVGVALLSANS